MKRTIMKSIKNRSKNKSRSLNRFAAVECSYSYLLHSSSNSSSYPSFVQATMDKKSPSAPDFSKGEGLLPAIAQDSDTGEVLMLAG